jgi:parvulin-like peptidyl-prolyl isomerase
MQGGAENAPPAAAAPTTTNVPMNEAVITLKGACQTKPGSAPPAGCVSSLTREQFEKLTGALQSNDKPVPPDVKRKFATQYAKLLTFADAARELGLQNDPKVQQIYTFAQNQILAETLNQHYREEYEHPTDQQIQDYYNQNLKNYMEVTLQRISIPINQGNPEKPKPTDDEVKAYAEKIRERWVAGEDPAKLEKEVYEHSGFTSTSPDVNLGARLPGSLPHEVAFQLKATEISEPVSDAAAYYIYKALSVRQVPLSEVKTSITQTLQRQMFQDKIQQVQSAVTPILNDAYFGPEPPPTPAMPGMPGMRPGMPPMRPGGPPAPGAGTPPPSSSTTPPNSQTPSK